MMNKKTIIFFVWVVGIPVLAFFGFRFFTQRVAPLPVITTAPVYTDGQVISAPYELPDFTFVNQHGNSVRTHDMKGKIKVVNFFFTHCPGICPAMSRNLQTVEQQYSSQDDVMILSYTVDPERDDVDRLSYYADVYSQKPDSWYFLTGDKKDLYALARRGYFISAQEGDGGEDDFIHSQKLILVDAKDQIRGYYDGTKSEEVDLLLYDIERLKDE